MDESSFDALTKSVARPPSRRQLLRFLGGGGAVAAAALGQVPRDSIAAAPSTMCTIAFTGTIRVGPSAGQLLAGDTVPSELKGQLAFTLDQQQAITQGQLTLPDGTVVPVVGQANGRAINLRMAPNDQQAIIAVGTADKELTSCQGNVDGLITGPQLGDLGDWHGTLSAPAAAVTPAAGNVSVSNPQQPPPSTTTPSPPRPTATVEPTTTVTATSTTTPPATTTSTTTTTAAPTCPICQQLSNGACVPVAHDTPCASGMVCCDGVCTSTANDPNHCGTCLHFCPYGCCRNGACVDLTSDPDNCGTCGNVCPADHPLCFNGSCAADHRGG